MEQTLGKRISENRKRLGLTQDQLAEKLGITAQAVSKWENDLSCPDIAILPALADIFGISTDVLLGREAPRQLVEAEAAEKEEPEGVHIHNGKWEFHWDSGKRSAVAFALMVLLVGALLLLTRIMGWEVSFWSLLWPSALLTWGISNLAKRFSLFYLALSLFSGYSLIANLGIWKLDIAGELVFPIMVVFFGIGLLMEALKKPNKPRFTITHGGRNVVTGSEDGRSEYSTGADCFDCSLSFGENTHLVELPVLAGGEASVSFGELHLDLTQVERIAEGCRIETNCSFGELELTVPRRFRVENSASTAFASVEVKGHPDPEPEGVIYLNANVSFGEITIRYV